MCVCSGEPFRVLLARPLVSSLFLLLLRHRLPAQRVRFIHRSRASNPQVMSFDHKSVLDSGFPVGYMGSLVWTFMFRECGSGMRWRGFHCHFLLRLRHRFPVQGLGVRSRGVREREKCIHDGSKPIRVLDSGVLGVRLRDLSLNFRVQGAPDKRPARSRRSRIGACVLGFTGVPRP